MQRGGNRFYFDFEGKRGLLPEKEAHHLVRVCRKREGEEILLINGKGEEFLGKIKQILIKGKKFKVEVEILRLNRKELPPAVEIVSLVPLLKGGRTDFLIEKGTELGVFRLVIFQSERTLGSLHESLLERFQEKALSALKQSGRLLLPQIELSQDLTSLLENLRDSLSLKVLASPEGKLNFFELLRDLKEPPERIYLLSGPEGGLTEAEREASQKGGFLEVSLSPYILRAETAALALMCLASQIRKNL